LIPDTPTKDFRLVKKHKRLQIIDKDGNTVYCPPDFLRRTYTRDEFEKMIDDANQNGKLSGELLTEFESKFRSRVIKIT
jgi:hypothetical protein